MPKSSKKVDDSEGQQESKYAINTGLTATEVQADLSSDKPAKVPPDGCTNTANVPNSHKLNNKPDSKQRRLDVELAEVAQILAESARRVQSAILMLIRTTDGAT